jgi:hypothetical protein
MSAMATEGTNQVSDELLTSRRLMYASFVRFSTWGIVFVAVLLIAMTLFLL